MLYLYGDPAYSCGFGITYPFEYPHGRRVLSKAQQAFNAKLSSVCIAIEQAFGDIQVKWTYTAFTKGVIARRQPVAAHFFTTVLLANC